METTDVPIPFPYPEGTPGFKNPSGGFMFCLNEKQQAALDILLSWATDERIDFNDLNSFALDSSLTLLRYLRANNFDTAKASSHIKKNLAWREENKVNNLLDIDPDDILGCSISQVTELLPHWHSGYDKTGRPVLYKQYGKFDITKLKEITSIESMLRYHIWEQEQCMKLCKLNSERTNSTIETVSAVIDIEGMKMTQINSDFLAIVKGLAQIDQQQYPESLGRFFIINTPSMFPFVWRMVKGFLDPAVAAKISIYGSRKDWEPALFEFIGKENMPSNYGGDLSELTTDVHPYAESVKLLRPPSVKFISPRNSMNRMTSNNSFIRRSQRGSLSEHRMSASIPYQYPDHTMGKDSPNGGFYHNLTDHQRHALMRVDQWVQDNSIEMSKLNAFALHPHLTILRYLRANNFSVSETTIHMTKNLAWRQENRVNDAISTNPDDILGCPMSQVTEYFPHWHSGYDKTGRPVLYKQYAKFDCTKLKEITCVDNIIRYHIWEQEQCMNLCLINSYRNKQTIETVSAVIDIEGMKMSQINSDFLTMVKALAQIDQQQYPESLGRFFIINTPSMFPLAWRMVKGFLDPAVAAKISIYGSRKDWEPALFEFIGKENMPSNYGGDLSELTTDVHPYEESMSLLSKQLLEEKITISSKKSSEHGGISTEAVLAALSENDYSELEPVVYPYPDNTPGKYSANGGFYHFLTDHQKTSLTSCQTWSESNDINIKDLNYFAIHPSLTLLRYLRANNFDTEKTIAQMMKNLAWREENKVAELSDMNPDDILGCPMSQVTELFPHWHAGYDKTGRPVLYKQYAKFDCTKLKEITSIENIIRYHIWEQEQCMKLCRNRSHCKKQTIETVSAVIDIEGMKMSQINSDFLAIVKGLAQIDQQQYPESLGRFFIINTPSMFPLAWRMVKGFLDPAVAAKISIYGSRKDWEPALFEFIGKENMPSNYGGDLSELTCDIHPYAESMIAIEASAKNTFHLNIPDTPTGAPSVSPLSGFQTMNTGRTYDSFKTARQISTSRLAQYETNTTGTTGNITATDSTNTPKNNKQRLSMFANNIKNVFKKKDPTSTSPSSSPVDENNIPADVESGVTGTVTSTQKKKKKKRSSDNEFEDYEPSLFRRMKGKVDRWMYSFTIRDLNFSLLVCLVVYTIIALTSMIISAVIMASQQFSSSSSTALWTGIVVLIVSILIILSNFSGFLGIYYQNRPLLQAYLAMVIFGTICFLVITVAGFIYAFDQSLQNAINRTIDDTASGEIYKDCLALAISSLVAFCISLVCIMFTAMLVNRLKKIQGTKTSPDKLRFVLNINSWITLLSAVVMLCYGAKSLSYLVEVKFSAMVFPVYGLIYGGFTIVLMSFTGMWVSYTSHVRIVYIFYKIIVPVVILLLIICGSLSFAYIPAVLTKVDNFSKTRGTDDPTALTIAVQTQLIVTGILCIFILFFEFSSLITARALYQAISATAVSTYTSPDRQHGIDVVTSSLLHGDEFLQRKLHRSKYDKYKIAWALVCALYNIYINGTYATLSRFVSGTQNDDTSAAVNSLWIWLGDNFDARYIDADPYLVVTSYFCAFVLGPSLIFYAWSTFVKAPFRHLVGIMVWSFPIWVNVILFCVEANINFVNYQTHAPAFAICFILWAVFGIICPSCNLYFEFRSANSSATKADNQTLLSHINRKDRLRYMYEEYGRHNNNSNNNNRMDGVTHKSNHPHMNSGVNNNNNNHNNHHRRVGLTPVLERSSGGEDDDSEGYDTEEEQLRKLLPPGVDISAHNSRMLMLSATTSTADQQQRKQQIHYMKSPRSFNNNNYDDDSSSIDVYDYDEEDDDDGNAHNNIDIMPLHQTYNYDSHKYHVMNTNGINKQNIQKGRNRNYSLDDVNTLRSPSSPSTSNHQNQRSHISADKILTRQKSKSQKHSSPSSSSSSVPLFPIIKSSLSLRNIDYNNTDNMNNNSDDDEEEDIVLDKSIYTSNKSAANQNHTPVSYSSLSNLTSLDTATVNSSKGKFTGTVNFNTTTSKKHLPQLRKNLSRREVTIITNSEQTSDIHNSNNSTNSNKTVRIRSGSFPLDDREYCSNHSSEHNNHNNNPSQSLHTLSYSSLMSFNKQSPSALPSQEQLQYPLDYNNNNNNNNNNSNIKHSQKSVHMISTTSAINGNFNVDHENSECKSSNYEDNDASSSVYSFRTALDQTNSLKGSRIIESVVIPPRQQQQQTNNIRNRAYSAITGVVSGVSTKIHNKFWNNNNYNDNAATNTTAFINDQKGGIRCSSSSIDIVSNNNNNNNSNSNPTTATTNDFKLLRRRSQSMNHLSDATLNYENNIDINIDNHPKQDKQQHQQQQHQLNNTSSISTKCKDIYTDDDYYNDFSYDFDQDSFDNNNYSFNTAASDDRHIRSSTGGGGYGLINKSKSKQRHLMTKSSDERQKNRLRRQWYNQQHQQQNNNIRQSSSSYIKSNCILNFDCPPCIDDNNMNMNNNNHNISNSSSPSHNNTVSDTINNNNNNNNNITKKRENNRIQSLVMIV